MNSDIQYYVFDLDGTLADISHRLHHIERLDKKDWKAFNLACKDDKPIQATINLLQSLYFQREFRFDSYISIWTCRNESVMKQTKRWLEIHNIYYDNLYMRAEFDYRPDIELKGRWLDEAIAIGETPAIIFEDRDKIVDYFRSRGIACLQVARTRY